MIIKDYFADGLLQIAIVLSLVRTDLHSFLGSSVGPLADRNHLLAASDGPLLGITRTSVNDFHSEDRFVPKLLDSYRYDRLESSWLVLSDLHALSDYRRFDGISTNVHAWLVGDAGAASSSTCNQHTTSASDNHHDDDDGDGDERNAVSEENVLSSSAPILEQRSDITAEPDHLDLFIDDELSKEVAAAAEMSSLFCVFVPCVCLSVCPSVCHAVV